MRLHDLLEAPNEFLHASHQKLLRGTLLTPRGEAMAGVDDDIEEILEKARPPDRPRRDAVVYMARDMRTLENVARGADYVYVVEPIGEVIRLDAAWINRLWKLFARNEDKLDDPNIIQQARDYAQGYWSGRPCPVFERGHEAIWEYMAKQANVVRRRVNRSVQ